MATASTPDPRRTRRSQPSRGTTCLRHPNSNRLGLFRVKFHPGQEYGRIIRRNCCAPSNLEVANQTAGGRGGRCSDTPPWCSCSCTASSRAASPGAKGPPVISHDWQIITVLACAFGLLSTVENRLRTRLGFRERTRGFDLGARREALLAPSVPAMMSLFVVITEVSSHSRVPRSHRTGCV